MKREPWRGGRTEEACGRYSRQVAVAGKVWGQTPICIIQDSAQPVPPISGMHITAALVQHSTQFTRYALAVGTSISCKRKLDIWLETHDMGTLVRLRQRISIAKYATLSFLLDNTVQMQQHQYVGYNNRYLR